MGTMTLPFKRVLSAALLVALLLAPTASVSASTSTFATMASPIPASTTPHALGDDKINKVLDITQAGQYMFYGGYFSKAANPQKTSTFTCNNLIIQNLSTGATSCPISFDGQVTALYTYPGNQYVYAGGMFSHVVVNGKTYSRKNVVKISVATMNVDTSFDAQVLGHSVTDVQAIGGHLILAGDFKSVRGVAKVGLASVYYITGGLTGYLNAISVAGTLGVNTGPTGVDRIAISPLHNRAMIIGNFTSISGKPHYRAASLLLGQNNATLSNWYAPSLASECSPNTPAYTRDIDFSPNGQEFALATTGARMKYPLLCDTVSMWPVSDSTNAQPRWIDYTPVDTLQSVLHTGIAVYVGGHQKAHNTMLYVNGVRQNVPEHPVSGIAALNATTGRAYNWPAGRDRGEGAKKLLAVQADAYHRAGVYVGSDTEWWYNSNGDRAYNRERIAFLPLQ